MREPSGAKEEDGGGNGGVIEKEHGTISKENLVVSLFR